MKKLLLLASVLMVGLLNAQTYPLNESFDGVTTSGSPATGALPTGWTTTSGFKVYANHGYSLPNACSTEMSSTHMQDTLYTPMIGPITAQTKLSLAYRFVDKALYPANGTQLATGDKVTIDANVGGSWQNSVATIDVTTNPTPLTTWTTYTYTNSLFSLLAGQNIQLRLDITRANGDWYLDIDNFIVADNINGIAYNVLNPPALIAYPNPAHGEFQVWVKNYQSTEPIEMRLFNHVGQLVKTLKPDNVINNQFNVSTTDLARGLYIVEVRSGNEVSKTKITVD